MLMSWDTTELQCSRRNLEIIKRDSCFIGEKTEALRSKLYVRIGIKTESPGLLF